jgi:hypothetical protein
MSHDHALAESKTAEALNATVVAAEATENARTAQIRELLAESDARNAKMIGEAITEAFGTNKAQGRYIDVTRIPLICQNIDGIHTTLQQIDKKIDEKMVTKERFSPVEKIVYGAVALILSGVVGALLLSILNT